MIVVAALALLCSQGPLLREWPGRAVEVAPGTDRWTFEDGGYYVPSRVLVMATIEAAVLIGWLLWKWVARKRCTRS